MAEYYAVERSAEYLAHYGIKGMRWGVRKSIAKGDTLRLVSHYDRATAKKRKLKEQANRKAERENAKAYAGGGAALLGAGALGGLASYGIIKGQAVLNRKVLPKSDYETYMVPTGLIGTSGLAAIGGLGALGASAASAYRSTKAGNKRAVKRYNEFSSAMNKTFDAKTKKQIYKYLRENPDHDFAALKKRRRG